MLQKTTKKGHAAYKVNIDGKSSSSEGKIDFDDVKTISVQSEDKNETNAIYRGTIMQK